MPKIPLPGDRAVQTGARQSSAGVSSIAATQSRISNDMRNHNQAYMEAAEADNDEIMYNLAMNKATETLTASSNERYGQTVDDNGNPTHTALPEDIGKLSEAAKKEASKHLLNPRVARRFEADFKAFSDNQVSIARSTARKQQLDFSRATLSKTLDSNSRQAVLLNPQQLGEYEANARRALDSALAAGSISNQEHFQLATNFTETVRKESYRNLIQGDPEATLAQLRNSNPLDIGISKANLEALIYEAEGAVSDKLYAAEAAQDKKKAAEDNHRNLVISQQNLAIERGELGASDILQSIDVLGELEVNKQLLRLEKSRDTESKKVQTFSNISEVIGAGGDLSSHNFAAKDIEAHFQDALEGTAEEGSQPSLSQKAAVAVTYKGVAVPSVNKELAHAAQFGDEDKLGEALQNYEFLKNEDGASVQGLSRADIQAFESMADMVENTSVPIGEIIEDVRDRVYKRDNAAREQRVQEFTSEKSKRNGSYTLSKIDGMIKDVFDDQVFGGNYDIVPGMSVKVQRMMEEAYIDSGRLSEAKRKVESDLKAFAGTSKVNGHEVTMFHPPEKTTGFPTEVLEANLNSLVASVRPDLDPKSVEVKSFSGTRGLFDRNGKELIQYVLHTRDQYGHEVPLTNENGVALKWTIDPNELRDTAIGMMPKKEDVLAEASKERRETAEDTNSVENILRTLTRTNED